MAATADTAASRRAAPIRTECTIKNRVGLPSASLARSSFAIRR